MQWLKEKELWESTVLMVMGDHGQASLGGHPVYEPGGYVTQLLVSGQGIKKGITYPYAEIIDIAPTVAWLHNVPTPKFNNGRVLKEITENNKQEHEAQRLMQQLNMVLIGNHLKKQKDTAAFTIEEIGSWHTGENGADYKKFVENKMKRP
ncbi:MAG: sulfatase-like hydrolase/transferase [Bacteroidales bacterium]|nr:sulfatase-like hydrolase/transferase [Bacteroidales bacterium]